MWSKNSGIMDPFLFTIGLAENAAENGAKFLFGHEILGIERVDDDYLLRTGKGEYKAHWVNQRSRTWLQNNLRHAWDHRIPCDRFQRKLHYFR